MAHPAELTSLCMLYVLLIAIQNPWPCNCRYGYVVASYGITGLWLVLSGIVMWAGDDKTLWNTSMALDLFCTYACCFCMLCCDSCIICSAACKLYALSPAACIAHQARTPLCMNNHDLSHELHSLMPRSAISKACCREPQLRASQLPSSACF